MKLLIVALTVAVLFEIGAQEVPPNTPPSPATEGGNTVPRLNSQQETGKAKKPDHSGPPVLSNNQCPKCCSRDEPNTQTEEEKTKAASLERLTRRYMKATIIGVIGAWLGIAVLIVQTIISRQTTQRQLRAYVLGESGSIFNVANPVPLFPGQVFQPTGAELTNPASGPGAIIQIKNTGQTPAFKVSHWGHMCFREFPLRAGLPLRLPHEEGTNKSILGPGIISTKLLQIPQPLTPAEVSDLRNGIGAIYVYGEIAYEDAFGKKRQSTYRLFHHPQGGAIGVSTTLSFADGGNDAN